MSLLCTFTKGLQSQKTVQELIIYFTDMLENQSFPSWSSTASTLLQSWLEKISEEGNLLCGNHLAKVLCHYVNYLDVSDIPSIVPLYLQLNNFVDLTSKWKDDDLLLKMALWENVNELHVALCNLNWSGLQDYMLSISGSFLNTCIDEDAPLFLRQIRLKALNSNLEKSTNDFKKQFRKANPSCIKDMTTVLRQVGDYDFQSNLVEAVFRLTSSSERAHSVTKWFPDLNCVLQHLFVLITDFDPDCRKFLNAYNNFLGHSRGVYTFACVEARIGSFVLTKPNIPSYEQLWVDFNLGSGTLSLLFDRSADNPSQSQGRCWEMIIIFDHEVESVSLTATIHGHSLVLRLGRDPIDFFASPPSEDSCSLLNREFFIEFGTHIPGLEGLCSKLFKEKIRVEASNSNPSKRSPNAVVSQGKTGKSTEKASISLDSIEQMKYESKHREKRRRSMDVPVSADAVNEGNSFSCNGPSSDIIFKEGHSKKLPTESPEPGSEKGFKGNAPSVSAEFIAAKTSWGQQTEQEAGNDGDVEMKDDSSHNKIKTVENLHPKASCSRDGIPSTSSNIFVRKEAGFVSPSKSNGQRRPGGNCFSTPRRFLQNDNSSSGTTSLYPSTPETNSSLLSSKVKKESLKSLFQSKNKSKKRKHKKCSKRNYWISKSSLVSQVCPQKSDEEYIPTVISKTHYDGDVSVDSDEDFIPSSVTGDLQPPIAGKDLVIDCLPSSKGPKPDKIKTVIVESQDVLENSDYPSPHQNAAENFNIENKVLSERETKRDKSVITSSVSDKNVAKPLDKIVASPSSKDGCGPTTSVDAMLHKAVGKTKFPHGEDNLESVSAVDKIFEETTNQNANTLGKSDFISDVYLTISDYVSEEVVQNLKELDQAMVDKFQKCEDLETNKPENSVEEKCEISSIDGVKTCGFSVPLNDDENLNKDELYTATLIRDLLQEEFEENGKDMNVSCEEVVIEKENTANSNNTIIEIGSNNPKNVSPREDIYLDDAIPNFVDEAQEVTSYINLVHKSEKTEPNTKKGIENQGVWRNKNVITVQLPATGTKSTTVPVKHKLTVLSVIKKPKQKHLVTESLPFKEKSPPISKDHEISEINPLEEEASKKNNAQETKEQCALVYPDNPEEEGFLSENPPLKSPSKSLASTLKILAEYPVKPVGMKTPKKELHSESSSSSSKRSTNRDRRRSSTKGKKLPDHYEVSTSPVALRKSEERNRSKVKLFDTQAIVLENSPPTELESHQNDAVCDSAKKRKAVTHSITSDENYEKELSDSQLSRTSNAFKFFKTKHTTNDETMSVLPEKIMAVSKNKNSKSPMQGTSRNSGADRSPMHSKSVFSDFGLSDTSSPGWFKERKKKNKKSVARTYKGKPRKSRYSRGSSDDGAWTSFPNRRCKAKKYNFSESSGSGSEVFELFKSPKKRCSKGSSQESRKICTRSAAKKAKEKIQSQSAIINSSIKNMSDEGFKKKRLYEDSIERVSSPEITRDTSLTQPSSVEESPHVTNFQLLHSREVKANNAKVLSLKSRSVSEQNSVKVLDEESTKYLHIKEILDDFLQVDPVPFNCIDHSLSSNVSLKPKDPEGSQSMVVDVTEKDTCPELEANSESVSPRSRTTYATLKNQSYDDKTQGLKILTHSFPNDSPHFSQDVQSKLDFDKNSGHTTDISDIDLEANYCLIPSRPNSDFSSSEEENSNKSKTRTNSVTIKRKAKKQRTTNTKEDSTNRDTLKVPNCLQEVEFLSPLVPDSVLHQLTLSQEPAKVSPSEFPEEIVDQPSESLGNSEVVKEMPSTSQDNSRPKEGSGLQDLIEVFAKYAHYSKTPNLARQDSLKTPEKPLPKVLFGDARNRENSSSSDVLDELVSIPSSTLQLLADEANEVANDLLKAARRSFVFYDVLKGILGSKKN